MRFDVMTLFTEQMETFFNHSILGGAMKRGIVEVHTTNIRDFAEDKHHVVDDYPYGGGSGMVLKPEPVFRAVESVKSQCEAESGKKRTVLLSASGKLFTQRIAQEYAALSQLILICGHYEGVDERVARYLADEELSVGNFVLTGGEPAACVVIDAVARCIPDVLGSPESLQCESFSDGLLEYPHYTRPEDFRGYKPPDVLLSGHHENIRRWRRYKTIEKTYRVRPELFQDAHLSDEDKAILNALKDGKFYGEGE